MLIKQSYRIGQKSDISLVVFSPGGAETNVWWGEKLNGHLMASCVRNYQNLIIDFQVTVENVGDVLFERVCTSYMYSLQEVACLHFQYK